MDNFTPVMSLLGGVLIGLAAIGLLFFNGRIGGISGIFGGLLNAQKGDTAWRAIFIFGLVVGGFLVSIFNPNILEFHIDRSVLAIIIGGLLVGFGSRLGSGCTSGHGVCGVGRLAPRSLIATCVFITTGIFSVYLVNHLLGGSI
ncbi:MAG: YeeE/YedE thiosulfate transporter family protein [Pseudomonadota bacterium]